MDNDLDDFFAKKDKSKKKTKSKFTVDDILQAKKDNEDKLKKGKAKKRTKDPNQSDGATGLKTEEDDEEWVEIEEETEKDYSGLRVQNLQITGKGDDDRQESASQREDGEDGESRDSVQGPWKVMSSTAPAPAVSNKIISTPEPVPVVQGPWKVMSSTAPAPAVSNKIISTPEPVPVVQGPWKVMSSTAPAPAVSNKIISTPEPVPVVQEVVKDTPKTSTKYVPPAMRAGRGDVPAVTVSSGSSKFNSRGGKKSAPNVNSQEDFPTLGSVAEPNEGAAFEKIKGGARQVDDPASRHIKLSVGNKFDALDADDS